MTGTIDLTGGNPAPTAAAQALLPSIALVALLAIIALF